MAQAEPIPAAELRDAATASIADAFPFSSFLWFFNGATVEPQAKPTRFQPI